jgi:hypothetical protein
MNESKNVVQVGKRRGEVGQKKRKTEKMSNPRNQEGQKEFTEKEERR